MALFRVVSLCVTNTTYYASAGIEDANNMAVRYQYIQSHFENFKSLVKSHVNFLMICQIILLQPAAVLGVLNMLLALRTLGKISFFGNGSRKNILNREIALEIKI